MALLKTLPHPFIIDGSIENAYCVIDEIQLDKKNRTGSFFAKAFVSQEDRAANAPYFFTHNVSISNEKYEQYFSEAALETDTPFKNAYLLLKEDADWSSCQDA